VVAAYEEIFHDLFPFEGDEAWENEFRGWTFQRKQAFIDDASKLITKYMSFEFMIP
jgi:hypothetical protein